MGRKLRRLFPKKYQSTYIPTSRIDHNKAAAYNMQRSKATEGKGTDTEHKLDNNFLQEIPRTRSLSTWDHDHKRYIRSERGRVVDKKHELLVMEGKNLFELYRVWSGKLRQQGVQHFNRQILEQFGDYKLFLFFSGNEYMLVQECQGTRWISGIYVGREEVLAAWENKFINWIVVESLSQTQG